MAPGIIESRDLTRGKEREIARPSIGIGCHGGRVELRGEIDIELEGDRTIEDTDKVGDQQKACNAYFCPPKAFENKAAKELSSGPSIELAPDPEEVGTS